MGLDITAYRKLTKVEGAKIVDYEPCDADGEPLDFWTHLYVLQPGGLEGREAPLEIGGVYAAEETHEFRAGSYIWYSDWRDNLARIAGYQPNAGGRFPHAEAAWDADGGLLWEWINFSDSEGVIGPVAAEKMYRELSELKISEGDFPSPNVYSNFMDKVPLWIKAWDIARHGGAVKFH
jgi:hypothetical protein